MTGSTVPTPGVQASPENVGEVMAVARGPKIVTMFVYPPIPIRRWDWVAYYDGDETNTWAPGKARPKPKRFAT